MKPTLSNPPKPTRKLVPLIGPKKLSSIKAEDIPEAAHVPHKRDFEDTTCQSSQKVELLVCVSDSLDSPD